MTKTRTPTNKCLDCGKELDAVSSVGHNKKPRPGDITICIECGHIMAFAAGMTLRPLTDEEMVEIAGDPQILIAQRARAHVMAMKRKMQP